MKSPRSATHSSKHEVMSWRTDMTCMTRRPVLHCEKLWMSAIPTVAPSLWCSMRAGIAVDLNTNSAGRTVRRIWRILSALTSVIHCARRSATTARKWFRCELSAPSAIIT